MLVADFIVRKWFPLGGLLLITLAGDYQRSLSSGTRRRELSCRVHEKKPGGVLVRGADVRYFVAVQNCWGSVELRVGASVMLGLRNALT